MGLGVLGGEASIGRGSQVTKSEGCVCVCVWEGAQGGDPMWPRVLFPWGPSELVTPRVQETVVLK